MSTQGESFGTGARRQPARAGGCLVRPGRRTLGLHQPRRSTAIEHGHRAARPDGTTRGAHAPATYYRRPESPSRRAAALHHRSSRHHDPPALTLPQPPRPTPSRPGPTADAGCPCAPAHDVVCLRTRGGHSPAQEARCSADGPTEPRTVDRTVACSASAGSTTRRETGPSAAILSTWLAPELRRVLVGRDIVDSFPDPADQDQSVQKSGEPQSTMCRPHWHAIGGTTDRALSNPC